MLQVFTSLSVMLHGVSGELQRISEALRWAVRSVPEVFKGFQRRSICFQEVSMSFRSVTGGIRGVTGESGTFQEVSGAFQRISASQDFQEHEDETEYNKRLRNIRADFKGFQEYSREFYRCFMGVQGRPKVSRSFQRCFCRFQERSRGFPLIFRGVPGILWRPRSGLWDLS